MGGSKRQTRTFWFSPISLRISELTTVLVMDLRGRRADSTVRTANFYTSKLQHTNDNYSVRSVPGFGGKILTEVPHDIQGFNSRSSEDTGGCLET